MQLNRMSDFIIFEYTSYVESQTLPLLKAYLGGSLRVSTSSVR